MGFAFAALVLASPAGAAASPVAAAAANPAADSSASPFKPPGADTRPAARHPPELPGGAFLVPIVRQETSYSCGPAVLAAVLRYFAVWSGHEQQLYPLLGTSPEEGTLPEQLAASALQFGLTAAVVPFMTLAELRTALYEHQLVILELQAWPTPGAPPQPWSSRWDDGHFVVLIALDEHYAYFMDPSTGDGYTYLELDELMLRWHDINPARKDPRLQRDYQLGVVIGKPAPMQLPRAVPTMGPASVPRRLHKLE